MKQNSFIYLRGLKHAAFTVFCVENGQKFYYDPQFNVRVPFSSGQQVKRSVLEKLNDILGAQPSPTGSNCTLLELKERFEAENPDAAAVLIVPYWN